MMEENKKTTKKQQAVTLDEKSDQQTQSSADDNLETVREILFGAQLREANWLREMLSQQLNDAVNDLKKSTDERFDSLERSMQTMRRELDQTSKKSNTEFNKKLDAVDQSLSKKLTELDEATSTEEAELAGQIDENIKILSEKMEGWKEELFNQLEEVHTHLAHDKTDRGTLADLFSVMSEQLMKDNETKE